jgi:hypothetical protein
MIIQQLQNPERDNAAAAAIGWAWLQGYTCEWCTNYRQAVTNCHKHCLLLSMQLQQQQIHLKSAQKT